jgi:hypothetical protein
MSVVSGPSRETGAIPRTSWAVGLGPSAGAGSSARLIGVDVARGLALLGMIAVHIFDTLHADNTPSKTHQVMAGWSPGAIRSWPIWRSSVSGW